MAGLFDDKSLKAPPLMGAKARNKLNKHGYYRMPPNMKGIHSAAEGGLGGAITKGRKLRGYAEGGLVDITDQEPNEIRGIGGSDMLIGGSGDDDLGVGGIAPDEQPTWEQALASPSAQSDAENQAAINQGTTNLGQIMAAMQQKNALTQQYLDNYKRSREGGVNLPALQFAAGLMSPTRTGSFGESMGAGIGMGASALAQQRKEDDAYNALKTKLGIDAAGQNVDDLIKLKQAESLNDYRKILAENRKSAAEDRRSAKIDSDTQKLSTALDKQGIPELGQALTEVEDALKTFEGKDVPGFGEVAGQLPDVAVSSEGLDLRQKVSRVGNAILKARSGGAVTPQEASRLLRELGVNESSDGSITLNARPDKQIVNGMKMVGDTLRAKIANVRGGFASEVIDEYKSRGGSGFDYEKRTEDKEAMPSPEATKQIGNKNYVKINGTWYEQ